MSTAQRYEAAWNHCYKQAAPWIQEIVIEEAFGRQAKAIAHEAAVLAESDTPTEDFDKVTVVSQGKGWVISGSLNE